MGELLSLAERCEQAAGPSQNLDAVIHIKAFGFEPRRAGLGWPDENAPVVPAFPGWKPLPSYTASIDAAMQLVPEGCCWRLGVNGNPKAKLLGGAAAAILGDDFGTDISKAGAATPALALCAAALRARAARSSSEDSSHE